MVRTQIRLPEDLHAELVSRAEKDGRTLNFEMVERLERARDDQSDASRLGEAVAMVAALAGEAASAHVPGKTAWADDPWAFAQVCIAITELLGYLRPEGADRQAGAEPDVDRGAGRRAAPPRSRRGWWPRASSTAGPRST